MDKLIRDIEQFKHIYQKNYVEKMLLSIPHLSLDESRFEFKNQATRKEIKLLEAEMNQVIPDELSTFYAEVGQLIDENQPENLTLWIPSVTDLLSRKGNEKWTQAPTFGLIDSMKLHWSNDRYELNEGQFLTTEQIRTLNETYTCIGYWCKEPFYEEAYFIVFDKNHQFSEVKYNQDRFGLLQIQLLDMLENGIAQKSLKELLATIFERLEKYTIAFAENG